MNENPINNSASPSPVAKGLAGDVFLQTLRKGVPDWLQFNEAVSKELWDLRGDLLGIDKQMLLLTAANPPMHDRYKQQHAQAESEIEAKIQKTLGRIDYL